MTEIINEVLPGHPVGVLTGPNLAREIIAGQAAASVMAMEDEIIVRALQRLFHSGLFRVYTNTDLVGCELGGVLKNVIALAVGMGDGQGAGDNTRSALITRGLAEITRLGVAMGGRPETFAGLAGMGDLIATCTSAAKPQPACRVRVGQRPPPRRDHRGDADGGRGREERADRHGAGRATTASKCRSPRDVFSVLQGETHAQPGVSRTADSLHGGFRSGAGLVV